jgi:hypothetical protein
MADEVLRADENNQRVIGLVTDDANEEIRMGRIDDATKGLKVMIVGGSGSGDVSKVGTPVNNQVAVWTGDGTIEGDTTLTFDTSTDTLTSGIYNSTSLTASEILITDGSKNIVSAPVATYPSLTELSYVKGLSSAIQTQLNAKLTSANIEDSIVDGHTTIAPSGNAVFDALALKAPLTAPTFATSITGSYLTASEILITDGSKNIVSAPVATYPSLTELSYVKGLSSAIQTQLNAKAPSASPTFTGTVTLPKTLEIQDTSADHQYVLAVSELTADRTITLPLLTGTDTFVFEAHTQTLTNKRITQRVVTTTDDATAIIDVDVTDTYELSAVANNTEFTVTGTPTDGQKLIVRYKDAGVTKNLTWTFATAIGVTLPVATTAGKWGYVGCVYNLAATQWHALAVGTQS